MVSVCGAKMKATCKAQVICGNVIQFIYSCFIRPVPQNLFVSHYFEHCICVQEKHLLSPVQDVFRFLQFCKCFFVLKRKGYLIEDNLVLWEL